MVPVPTKMVQYKYRPTMGYPLVTKGPLYQKWSPLVPPDGPLQGIPFAWRVSAGPSGVGILEQVILIAFYATAQLFYLFFSPFFYSSSPSSPPSPNFSPQSSTPTVQSLYQLLQMFLFFPSSLPYFISHDFYFPIFSKKQFNVFHNLNINVAFSNLFKKWDIFLLLA